MSLINERILCCSLKILGSTRVLWKAFSWCFFWEVFNNIALFSGISFIILLCFKAIFAIWASWALFIMMVLFKKHFITVFLVFRTHLLCWISLLVPEIDDNVGKWGGKKITECLQFCRKNAASTGHQRALWLTETSRWKSRVTAWWMPSVWGTSWLHIIR